MYKIRKVFNDDFNKTLPLFDFFRGNDNGREHWSLLFKPICKELNNDFFGFVLECSETGDIGGFLGCNLSIRHINGKNHKICNMTSLVIKPELRKQNLAHELVKNAIELDGYSIQGLSPIEKTIPYYLNLGFKYNQTKFYTLLRPPFPWTLNKRGLSINSYTIENMLSENDLRLYHDHQFPDVYHVIYKYKNCTVYCIIKPSFYSSYILNSSPLINFFTKAWFKVFGKDFFKPKIKLGLIHYVNNPELFSESIFSLVYPICRKMGAMGLSVSDNFLKRKGWLTLPNKLVFPGLYKSDELTYKDLDTLYSELLVLNLNHYQL